MPNDQISTHEYMRQGKETREALTSLFNIPRTGRTETITDAMGNSKCISNGTTFKDLEFLTFDKLITFLGEASADDNIHSLFNKVVTKIETYAPPKEPEVFEEALVQLVSTTGPEVQPASEIPPPVELVASEEEKPEINKCQFCGYENASIRGLRMHYTMKHPNR